MKSIITLIAVGSLLTAIPAAQPLRYTVTDLGPLGLGQAYFIASNGLTGGSAAVAGGALHAVLWYNGQTTPTDIGTPGIGGPNSAVFGVNQGAQAVGEAETSVPNGEDFCGFSAYGFPSSKPTCLPFLWQNGVMTKLPTLGGPNGTANSINNLGQVAGWAQNNTTDTGCTVHQFKPVIWENGTIRSLPTYSGDPDGVAAQINDNGQAVGASGDCAPFNMGSGLYLLEKHALLWENGATAPHDLGNLGGTGAFGGHHACALNNQGQVVGHSDLANDTTFHGFLWTKETDKMHDLGTLPGDFASLALGINDGGVIVGASFDKRFNARATLWENGAMVDLNNLAPANSGLKLQFAFSINSLGEIVGLAMQKSTGQPHGFLATPVR